MDSNESVGGGQVDSMSISMIDNIFITGYLSQSVNQISISNQIRISPNPGNGRFMIFSEINVMELSIFDSNGRGIIHKKFDVWDNNFPVHIQEKGIFFLKLILEGDYLPVSKKLVVIQQLFDLLPFSVIKHP